MAKLGLSQIVVEIELEFSGNRIQQLSNNQARYRLEHTGDVTKFAVTASESLHGGNSVLQDGYNMPVSDIAADTVERQLEGFVARAMKAEAGVR